MSLSRCITVLALALLLQACALFPIDLASGPITGVVTEEGTQKPIEGATVLVRWIGRVTSGILGRDTCYHVETATTDAQGRYTTRAWSQPQEKHFTVRFEYLSVWAHKPGYGFPKKLSQIPENAILAPFAENTSERLAYLAQIRMDCGRQHDNGKNVLPYLKALLHEANSIAVTAEDKKVVRSLRYVIDSFEFGDEVARKRLNQGAYEK